MPVRQTGHALLVCAVALIGQLARSDESNAERADPRDHWAYRPIEKQAVPPTQYAAFVIHPIDAFIAEKLEANGMAPSPPADRRTLIRRLSFDLLGLPPTPEEVAQFVADDSPDAYERLVDRLLASPHYGERWARHWMDVVHFAETHGNDQDRPRPNAWPYRDYLIRSFNDDKPYSRFVEEQIAGDVSHSDDPQAIVATGFIAAGPWDESSQRDIKDDTIDKTIAQVLDRDDMVTTTLATFASTTIHCARCHNHKFDPITQTEYYALQAVFAGVDRANRPYDPDVAVHQRRQALLRRKAELSAGREKVGMATLLDARLQQDVAEWERSRAAQSAIWTPLDAVTIVSAQGSLPARQPGASVLFGGKRPESDTYTIVVETGLQNITGVRLEVLTDDSLPQHGPGRQDNGNLHLTEFRLRASPLVDRSIVKDVALQNPTADFEQSGWTIAMAIDGQPKTAWGIYPEVAEPHVAVFQCKEPIDFDGGTALTFTLEQNHGGGHLIGRQRLSATTSSQPRAEPMLPDAVAEALAVAPLERSNDQKAELALHVLREQIDRELAALPPPSFVYAAANDFVAEGSFKPAKTPRPVFVLRRGDVNQPMQPAVPGALSCLPDLPSQFSLENPSDEGSRRAALASWLTDPANVLTWRSIVNRVWHYHFGRGIVDTPNDLGHMGSPPTHPELLDWLAAWFLDHGGSLKELHRLIVTSVTYRQSSRHNEEYARLDGGNRYLWRMNRTRLDAESLRDAVLLITGKLDRTMGGPSVKQFIESAGVHVTPKLDYENFDVDSPAGLRRSVYRFLFRTLPDPFMDSMDCADASQLTPTRNASVTALQALSMLNNHFMVRQSEHFAERLSQITGDLRGQIEAMYQLALGRSPSEHEAAALVSYATKYGLANACRLILNSNEFMFVQ
jgi:hypothetical protein